MKVHVKRNKEGTFDVRIRRTRRVEGDNASAKGLTRAELTPYVLEHVTAITPIPLPEG